jgi:hypothetical protein
MVSVSVSVEWNCRSQRIRGRMEILDGGSGCIDSTHSTKDHDKNSKFWPVIFLHRQSSA